MLIKKILLAFIFTLFVIFSCFTQCFSASEISLSAESAVVINADTKEIIFEKNAFKKRSMASTTKIMTSIIAIESGLLSEEVYVDTISSDGSSIGLKKGNRLSLLSLVYGMLLESGNDAAEVTAEFFSGSEEKFSDLMNKKAREIGMEKTNFETASGLDSENHYSCAYDMALLGSYAVKNPVFRLICSSEKKRVGFIEPAQTVSFFNHNRLLSSCEGVFGIKTGFTKKSGRCLVTACEREGVTLVAVTLRAPDDWRDHEKLYESCFSKIRSENITFDIPESINIYGGENEKAKIKLNASGYKYSYIHKGAIETQILLPQIVYAPLKVGDSVGKARVYLDKSLIFETDIIVRETIEKSKIQNEPYKTLREKLKEKLSDIFKLKG